MITVVCGEDSMSSRSYLLELIDKYKQNNSDITRVGPTQIEDILKDHQLINLFEEKKIYVTENLNRYLGKKASENFIETLNKIDQDKDIHLLVWEDEISSKELKLKNLGKIKEFKPDKNIFKLLDACYPGNLKSFIFTLESISKPQNEMFVFIMLHRLVRTLILIKSGAVPSTLQPWQIGKLKKQASYWDLEKLISFYEGLYKIDVGLKTGRNPYGIKKSIDILVCLYL